MLCNLKKLSIKQGLKTDICHFEKIYRKNNNCRVAIQQPIPVLHVIPKIYLHALS